ncbi:unnamed protein product [Protopolystoma xenopodis]|uniref:Uncharacterized protein n=1 Tax=Protopolystoma xenopodis TaxID=117903 RepID=A0A3S4ZTJ8_9PLAT|nr:unnamed protein product [Protopolystoma xenopodis]
MNRPLNPIDPPDEQKNGTLCWNSIPDPLHPTRIRGQSPVKPDELRLAVISVVGRHIVGIFFCDRSRDRFSEGVVGEEADEAIAALWLLTPSCDGLLCVFSESLKSPGSGGYFLVLRHTILLACLACSTHPQGHVT